MLVALGASRPCHLFCTKLWIFRIQVTITFSLWNKTAQNVGKLGKMMELEWQRTKHKWIVPGRRENCGTHAVLLPLVSEFKQRDNCPREETEAFFTGGTDWLYILIHWSHPSGKKCCLFSDHQVLGVGYETPDLLINFLVPHSLILTEL